MTVKSQVTWTKDEIQFLHTFGTAMLPYELQKFIPRHTQMAIATKRKRLGIKLPESYRIRMGAHARSFVNNDDLCKGDQTLTLSDFSPEALQLLLGSILGDGCIKKNSGGRNREKTKLRNYLFYEGHGAKQTDYVKWKCDKFSFLNARFFSSSRKKTGTNIYQNCPEMCTTSYPLFTELRKKIYGDGHISSKTYIPLNVFSQLDLFGLLIWYLDDGYFGKNRAPPSIACKGWDDDDLDAIVESLNVKFSLTLYVYRSKFRVDEINKIIKFRVVDKKKIFPIWEELFVLHKIPECMKYKLGNL